MVSTQLAAHIATADELSARPLEARVYRDILHCIDCLCMWSVNIVIFSVCVVFLCVWCVVWTPSDPPVTASDAKLPVLVIKMLGAVPPFGPPSSNTVAVNYRQASYG